MLREGIFQYTMVAAFQLAGLAVLFIAKVQQLGIVTGNLFLYLGVSLGVFLMQLILYWLSTSIYTGTSY